MRSPPLAAKKRVFCRMYRYKYTGFGGNRQETAEFWHGNQFLPHSLQNASSDHGRSKTGLPRPVLCGEGRVKRPRRTAGPGLARVLVHPGETWSHPRGTLGRCLKGSEINIQCLKYCIVLKNSKIASPLQAGWLNLYPDHFLQYPAEHRPEDGIDGHNCRRDACQRTQHRQHQKHCEPQKHRQDDERPV